MKVLEWLEREHDAIAGMLARLEAELARTARDRTPDAEALERLLAFFEARVDGQHQEGEERTFLPLLLGRTSGLTRTLVAEACRDHGVERALLARARAELEGAAYGEPGCVAEVLLHGRAYVAQQREHARWERLLVMPVAHDVLDAEDDRRCIRALRTLARDHGGTVVGAARALERWFADRDRRAAA